MTTEIPRANGTTSREKGFWKLNTGIMDDPDFKENFNRSMADILNQKGDYDSVINWFDSCFKAQIKELLIKFSKFRISKRKNTRDLLSPIS